MNQTRLKSLTGGKGSYTAIRMDPSREQQFFVMSHPDFKVQIGYIFPTAKNPWVGDWMENQRNQTLPWSAKRTRAETRFVVNVRTRTTLARR